MEIRKIHNRGILFTFNELNTPPFNCITNVYVIIGKDRYYICDTYLGPVHMKKIKQYLEDNYSIKEYTVFNSHFHWDHIWGNMEFKDSRIIAHERTKEMMLKYAEGDLETYRSDFASDDIRVILPSETFETNVYFEDDLLEFFHSPGHTEDSSSCFDYEDRTLFVGDNIDDPIPSFFDWDDLKRYKTSLENYLSYNPERVIQGHGEVMKPDVIVKNIEYLDSLIKGRKLEFENDEVKKKHLSNLEFLAKVQNGSI